MKKLILIMMLEAATSCIWGQPFNPQSRFERYQREQQIDFQNRMRNQERSKKEAIVKGVEAIKGIERMRRVEAARVLTPLQMQPLLPPLKSTPWIEPVSFRMMTDSLPRDVGSLLRKKMHSQLDIDSGLVIVMNIQKDSLVDMLGIKKENGIDKMDNCLGILSPATIMGTATYLSVLENGGIPEDTIDTGHGIFITNQGDSVFDHNFHKGGYGTLSLESGIVYRSDIVQAWSIEEFLPNGYQTLAENLRDMGVNIVGEFSDYQSLQEVKMNPFDMLSWMNCVAKGDVPNVSKENVLKLQKALRLHIEEGMGKGAKSYIVQISGTSYSAQTEEHKNFLSFLGYFPNDNPQYSIYVELYKNGKPASARYAAELFREIAETISIIDLVK